MNFQNITIPDDLVRFLACFVREFPQVQEIWLFGSRADGTASDDSDWDLLVFSGDQLTAGEVATAQRFRSEHFTLFIANDDEFQRPWPRSKDNAIECGSFSDWKWEWTGDRAEYTSAKEDRRLSRKPAVRIWVRPSRAEDEEDA